jgi:hypothetical protein
MNTTEHILYEYIFVHNLGEFFFNKGVRSNWPNSYETNIKKEEDT